MSTEEQGPYVAATPYGPVEVFFGPEDHPFTRYEGDPNVVAWLKERISQITNGIGASIDPDTIDPSDLLGFCQSQDVMILPPFDALAGLTLESP